MCVMPEDSRLTGSLRYPLNFYRCVLSRRPLQLPSAEQVHMKMGDALTSLPAVVDNKAEAFIRFCKAEVTGNFAGDEQQVPQCMAIIVIVFTNPGDCFFRDDQDVLGSLWIDVPESDREIILVENICRDLA